MLIAPNAKEAPTVVSKTQRAVKCGPRKSAYRSLPFQTHFHLGEPQGGTDHLTGYKGPVVNLPRFPLSKG